MSIPFSDSIRHSNVGKSHHWVLLLRHACGASTFSQSLGGATRLVVPKLQQSCTSLLASELRNVCIQALFFFSWCNRVERSQVLFAGWLANIAPFARQCLGKEPGHGQVSGCFSQFFPTAWRKCGWYMLLDITNCIWKRPHSRLEDSRDVTVSDLVAPSKRLLTVGVTLRIKGTCKHSGISVILGFESLAAFSFGSLQSKFRKWTSHETSLINPWVWTQTWSDLRHLRLRLDFPLMQALLLRLYRNETIRTLQTWGEWRWESYKHTHTHSHGNELIGLGYNNWMHTIDTLLIHVLLYSCITITVLTVYTISQHA